MARKLTAGQKAAATRKKNAAKKVKEDNIRYVEVKYGRPGINGIVGNGLIEMGSSHEDALEQLGVEINTTKEQLLSKETGNNVGLDDEVEEGTYMIVPGIDSSN